jgi:type I restriction enzyme S subunit
MNNIVKFKKTEIGMVPEDWDVRKLGEVADIIKGLSYKGKNLTDKSDLILLNLKNISAGGGFKDTGIKYYNGEFKDSHTVKYGDIIVALTDLTQKGDVVGSPAIVPHLEYKCIISMDLAKLKPKEKVGIINKFLYYLLLSHYFKGYCRAHSTGTTVLHLKTEDIKNFKFGLPPLKEQQKIAEILSSLDEKIELNIKMNKTLEEIAKTIFKRWFINFEFPNEEGKPYKSSGGEFINSELGEIPKGWRVGKIKEFGKVITGKTPTTKDKENFGNKYPFIKIPDMNDTYTILTSTYLSEKGRELMKNRELPPNSICVSCIATVGLVSLTAENISFTNQQINSIVCNEEISPYFVYLYMKILKNHIENLGMGGTATLNVNKKVFENIKIILPEQKILNKFHKIVNPIFSKILNNQKEIQTLTKIRDTLLPKLITGKIRVKV